jgi:8-oxo-dGTP pyrophosphatase MutT (NUDIX family)
VRSSRSFALAHVFPGGNLDPFHDGEIPASGTPGLHADGPAYRLGAVRECFEESGILLARGRDGGLLNLERSVREAARKEIHSQNVRFGEWLSRVGGEADVGG